jgi:hypothetical protein
MSCRARPRMDHGEHRVERPSARPVTPARRVAPLHPAAGLAPAPCASGWSTVRREPLYTAGVNRGPFLTPQSNVGSTSRERFSS